MKPKDQIVPLRIVAAALPPHAQFRIVQRPALDRHGRSVAQPVLMLDLAAEDVAAIEEALEISS